MSRRPALYAAVIRPLGMGVNTDLIESTVAIGYGARDLGAAYDKYSILKTLVSGQPGFEAALIDILGRRELRVSGSYGPEDTSQDAPVMNLFPEAAQTPVIEAETAVVDPEVTMVPMAPIPADLKLSEPMSRALEDLGAAKPNTVKALETRGLVTREPEGKGFRAKLTNLGRRVFRRNQAK